MLNLWTRPTLDETGLDKWTFGQVMALLVVLAPVITSVEGYVKGELLRTTIRTTHVDTASCTPQLLISASHE